MPITQIVFTLLIFCLCYLLSYANSRKYAHLYPPSDQDHQKEDKTHQRRLKPLESEETRPDPQPITGEWDISGKDSKKKEYKHKDLIVEHEGPENAATRVIVRLKETGEVVWSKKPQNTILFHPGWSTFAKNKALEKLEKIDPDSGASISAQLQILKNKESRNRVSMGEAVQLKAGMMNTPIGLEMITNNSTSI